MNIENRKLPDWAAAAVAVILLFLTAMGQAFAMFVFGAAALAIGLIFFRRELGRGAGLVIFASCISALLIVAVFALVR